MPGSRADLSATASLDFAALGKELQVVKGQVAFASPMGANPSGKAAYARKNEGGAAGALEGLAHRAMAWGLRSSTFDALEDLGRARFATEATGGRTLLDVSLAVTLRKAAAGDPGLQARIADLARTAKSKDVRAAFGTGH